MLGTVFFFTNWGFLLLTLYFASIVVYSLRPPPVAAEGARPPRCVRRPIWVGCRAFPPGLPALVRDMPPSPFCTFFWKTSPP